MSTITTSVSNGDDQIQIYESRLNQLSCTLTELFLMETNPIDYVENLFDQDEFDCAGL